MQVLPTRVQKQLEARRTYEKLAQRNVYHLLEQNGALARAGAREANSLGIEGAVHRDQDGHPRRADNARLQAEEETDVKS